MNISDIAKTVDHTLLRQCATEEEEIRLCHVVGESGADYIKTSTGFGGGGATFEDVALMRRECPKSLKIKASGGISTLADAEKFLSLGADRLGTSRVIRLIAEGVKNE